MATGFVRSGIKNASMAEMIQIPSLIVVVDDEDELYATICGLFDERVQNIKHLSGADATAEFIHQLNPDIVILTDRLVGQEQIELCRAIKADGRGKGIACLVVIGPGDNEHIAEFLDAGADDCLPHPLNAALLQHNIHRQLEWNTMQDNLQQNLLQQKMLAEVSSDYAYEATMHPDGTVSAEWFTSSIEDVTGYTSDELKEAGDFWDLLVHPDDHDVLQARRKLLLQGKEVHGTIRMRRKDGTDVTLITHIRPVEDKKNGIRIYGAGRDVTELRRTREALRTSQQTLEMALDAGEIGIWDWDMKTNETYFSDGWLRMLGYEPGEIEQNFDGWKSLVHAEDLPATLKDLTLHVEQDKPYEVEHRLKTKSGKWRWIQSRGRVIARDKQTGEPLRMVGVHRDVQENREMRDALKVSEERHRIISQTVSDYAYAYTVGENGTLHKDWSTAAFSDITGYSFDELPDDGWVDLVHPKDVSLAAKRFHRLLSGKVDVTEFRIITKSGETRWLRDHGYPITDEDGVVVRIYGAAQDVTQRRIYEERLREQAIELKARNDELDAFAYTVAHDLKNPISTMMGFASLILTYFDRMSEEEIQEHVKLILDSGYRLKNIINALLTLAGVSKMEDAETTDLDMQAIVNDSIQRVQSLVEGSGAKITVPKSWPTAQGYAPWVEEIWANYLSNAIKYGGSPPVIKLGARKSNGKVRFWIKDNGTGLTPEEQEHVFTPFTRLSQIKVEGHGLGLSVVQRIVERLGGEVGVESKPGRGSTFSFTLPASEN